ncbi:LacI family DNA-binding transcriptional regulator [Amphibacillus sp. Q70]|uniref:LacI family DNA-binding transcriptional regulator n=1 Tax=Amphibacillus sp. Q70 TaxID=3453416 RepID=UPI003F847776
MKIEDIARLANVSKSAVSLAINGKPGVSAETRQRILNIVEEQNYVPLRSVTNRSKKKRTIRFIACKSPDLITDQYQSLPFFNELISYLSSEINNYPYDLVISTFDENTILKELNEAEQEQESEGIILLGTNLTKKQICLIHNHYENLVILDTHHPDIKVNFVSINNFLGGYLAADYVIEQGHKKIGYVKGVPTITNFKERKQGFFSRLQESSLTIPDNFIFELSAMEIQNGIEIKKTFELLEELPTAIFCENDYMAISLMKSLKSIGIIIPDQISVVGFDDIRESLVISPELTTLQVNKREMAIQTLNQLDQLINKSSATKHVQVNTSLIERESTTSIKQKNED